MQFYYFFKILCEVVFRTTDNTEVGSSPFWKADWNFQFFEFVMACRILHLSQDNALLHLTDVLFFHHSHQIFESDIHLVWVELVTFAHALA